MASNDDTDGVLIEPTPIADRVRQRKHQISLFAFLIATCLVGAALGTVGRHVLHARHQKAALQAELAAFQGRWVFENNPPFIGDRTLLVVTNDDFEMFPVSYGKIRIDVTTSPKTVDFEYHPFGGGSPSRMTCQYSLEGDRLTLRLVGASRPDGSYAAMKPAASELVAIREPEAKAGADKE